jgi:hypothetical protein
MKPLTLDECLLLECAEEYDCPLWEAAWIFTKDKRERGERAIRKLVENNLVVFSRTKSWLEEIIIPLSTEEQLQVLDDLHEHEDWSPCEDTNKSFISFYITAKGKDLLHHDVELGATLRAHAKVRATREGEDRWLID